MIRYTIGWLLVFETAFVLVPLTTAAVYTEPAFFAFLGAMGVSGACGFLLMHKKPKDESIYAKEGFVIVALAWIVMGIFGALPFMFTGVTRSYVDALFEIVSGFTTTGASIFSTVEDLPRSILIWRSFSNWVGGMGVLVFIMAFLPLSGAHNIHLMRAESPGPEVSKLVPRMKNTAKILYVIYLAMTVVMFFILLSADMPIFDAINTSFSTAGTGGFSFKNDGFLSTSPAQQIIVTVFLILFSINFNSYYLVLKLKFKDAFNSEVKIFLLVVAAAITIITVNLVTTTDLFGDVGETIRHVAFTVASIISTCGFATVDFNLWPELSKTVLVIIMFTGACAGSTAGGIKISRLIILFKGFIRELQMLVHPKQVKKITIDKRPVDHEVIRSANAFIACYFVVFVVSIIAISFDDGDLVTNFTAVAASLNNIGPGLGAVGPYSNFGHLSVFSKIVLIFDMLIGRLELFPMLILFLPSTWARTKSTPKKAKGKISLLDSEDGEE